MKRGRDIEPQEFTEKNSLCSPKKYPAKSGTQEIRIFLSS
jgi:hypothetical protein